MQPTDDLRTMRAPLSFDELGHIMNSATRAPVGVATSVPYTLAVIVTSMGSAPKLMCRKAMCDPAGDEKLQLECRARALKALGEYATLSELSHVHWGRMKVETDDHYFGMQLEARPMGIDVVATVLLMPDIMWAYAFPQITGPMRALFRGEEFVFACCAYCAGDYAEELEPIWGLGILDMERARVPAAFLFRRQLWSTRSIESVWASDPSTRDGVRSPPTSFPTAQ